MLSNRFHGEPALQNWLVTKTAQIIMVYFDRHLASTADSLLLSVAQIESAPGVYPRHGTWTCNKIFPPQN